MSWRTRSDLGTEVVGHVYDAMKVTEGWSLDIGRGFTWWADDFAQTIWSDHGMFLNAQNTFRIHAETDLFRGRGHAQDFELELTAAMHDATLNGVIYDLEKDTFKLHSSVYVTSDNVDYLDKLFMASCAMQVAEAHEIGHHLAQKLGAVPATSGHPTHGLRNQPDAMLKGVEMFFAPAGRQPSRWIGQPEWKEMERAMERQSLHFECDHTAYLRAEFGWPINDASGARQFSILEVKTDEPNPIIGHGLMMRLTLPIKLPPAKCAHTALELNNMERKEWLRCQFLGSWCADDGLLEYECFVPNTSYNHEILEALSLSVAIRAEWVAEVFAKWFAAAQS